MGCGRPFGLFALVLVALRRCATAAAQPCEVAAEQETPPSFTPSHHSRGDKGESSGGTQTNACGSSARCARHTGGLSEKGTPRVAHDVHLVTHAAIGGVLEGGRGLNVGRFGPAPDHDGGWMK